jgi:hypothetical protein
MSNEEPPPIRVSPFPLWASLVCPSPTSLQRRTEDKTDGVGLVVTKKENASNQDDDVKTN